MSAMNIDNFDFFTSLGSLHGSEEDVFRGGGSGHLQLDGSNFSLSPPVLESPVMDSSPDFSFQGIGFKPELFPSLKAEDSIDIELPQIQASFPQQQQVSAAPVKLESPVAMAPMSPMSPLKSPSKNKTKSEKKSRKVTSRQERQEQRKIKHRLIDRKRRMREKHSIEELKDLVAIQPSEKPDKATVVAGAVRTIKDLQQQIAELEAQLARQSPSPALSSSSPSPEISPFVLSTPMILSDEKKIGSYKDYIALTAVMSGLGNSGVVAVVVGLQDCAIKDVNSAFEIVSGFQKSEVVGKKFSDEPLFGRHVHGIFPRDQWKRPSDPQQALIPTASSEDYTYSDFQHALNVVLRGEPWRVITRHLTRDGLSVVESFNTLFLLRDLDRQPYAIMCISTPDQRRVVRTPLGRPLGSHPTPVICQVDLQSPLNFVRAPLAQPS